MINMRVAKEVERKALLLDSLRMTSHDPISGSLFTKTHHTYGKALPPMNLPSHPTLSELGLRLAGKK